MGPLALCHQTRRHGGAFRGRAPPKWLLAPPPNENCAQPSEDCAPKKLTGLGLLECKSRPKLVFAISIFVIFVGWHRISGYFWDEDLSFFFFEITRFRPEKTFEVSISAGKSLRISVKTFFFGDHLSLAGKTFQFLIAAGKSLWIFGLHLVHLIQTGINFSCPPAPLEFT